MPTIDHQIPTSRGGTDDLDNLVLACARCNARKNNKTADEYLIWRIHTVVAKREAAAA
jgi:5-methylcytosine-specific restriction endonuclease McrA